MKKLISFLLISVLLTVESSSVFAQEKKLRLNDTVVCLQVIGIATEGNQPIEGIVVVLYKENEELEWDEITSIEHHEHHFVFNLFGNSNYTIEISKSGYVTRSLGFSTVLPDNIKIDGIKFTFDFEVELFEIKDGADDYYMDFPVALIAFNKTSKRFENNTKYTKHIKTKIKETIGGQQENPVSLHKY